jgi:tripartite-type tricarboxylate transporter receptor subunit TctC
MTPWFVGPITTLAAFSAYLKAEVAKWAKVVKAANIKLQL